MIQLELPYPPSLNNYYRSPKVGVVLISRAGRAYREAVWGHVLEACIQRMYGPLDVRIVVHPPSPEAVQDVDNSLKALFDALQKSGAYANDRQICHLDVLRGCLRPGGLVRIWIDTWKGEGAEHAIA